jgi:hypothetical protein
VDSDKKQEKKNLAKDKFFDDEKDKIDQLFEGKMLHDLYRHTTKLIK